MVTRLMINDNVVINKKDVTSDKTFKALISLYNLDICSENSDHYILEGFPNDLDAFAEFWSGILLKE